MCFWENNCLKSTKLKLKLINKKTYKNKFENTSIEKIENTLKKALHVIYKYHLNNKRILK